MLNSMCINLLLQEILSNIDYQVVQPLAVGSKNVPLCSSELDIPNFHSIPLVRSFLAFRDGW